MGSELTRSFDLTADRLTITSLAGEPHMYGVTRWIWERVPTIVHLDDRYHAVIGKGDNNGCRTVARVNPL